MTAMLLAPTVFFQFLSANDGGNVEFILFEDFHPKTVATNVGSGTPQWYLIEIGYAFSTEVPIAKEFSVQGLPPKLLQNGQITKLEVMVGHKSQHTDYTLITRDPSGELLDKPLVIGEAVYAAVTATTATEISLSFYYYDNQNVIWHNHKQFGLPPYRLDGFTWDGEWKLPLNTWLIVSKGDRINETIKYSKLITLKEYRYAFVRIKRI